nr:MBL fold metallo-hydrolase [Intestinimonas butyriciproducens]
MENTAPEGLLCEHGLSLMIEHGGRSILLDAGSSAALLDNAARLGVDLSRVDAAVLSHGHYDHSGGFCAFFQRNPSAPLYLREEAAQTSYVLRGDARKYLGVPQELLSHGARLHYVTARTELFPGVWLLPHNTPGLESRGERVHMYRQTGSGLIPDDFAHEQSLVFVTTSGLILFSSCSHAGADTVTEEAMAAFPGLPVRAFLGGFHLMGASGAASLGVPPEEAVALGRRLLELGIGEIWTGHCTGTPAFELLRPVLGERLHALSTGSVVEL